MAYNAAVKAEKSAELLEYILAVELFSGFQAQQFIPGDLKRGKGTSKVLELLKASIHVMEEDYYLYPDIEKVRELIHNGEIVGAAESAAGPVEL